MNSSALQQFNISRGGNEMVINNNDEFMENTGGRETKGGDMSMVQLNDAYNINMAKIQIEAIDSSESKNRLMQVKEVLKNSKTLKE